MFDAGLVKPRTTIWYKDIPLGFHVMWIDSETAIVECDAEVYKIRREWVADKADFTVDLDDAVTYVKQGGDPKDPTLDHFYFEENMAVMSHHEWEALLKEMENRFADD